MGQVQLDFDIRFAIILLGRTHREEHFVREERADNKIKCFRENYGASLTHK